MTQITGIVTSVAPMLARAICWQTLIRAVPAGLSRLLEYQTRIRQRRALLGLNPRLLKDIGVSHADVWLEMSKPFWKP